MLGVLCNSRIGSPGNALARCACGTPQCSTRLDWRQLRGLYPDLAGSGQSAGGRALWDGAPVKAPRTVARAWLDGNDLKYPYLLSDGTPLKALNI